jgi:hypothetical protein
VFVNRDGCPIMVNILGSEAGFHLLGVDSLFSLNETSEQRPNSIDRSCTPISAES